MDKRDWVVDVGGRCVDKRREMLREEDRRTLSPEDKKRTSNDSCMDVWM